MYRGFFRKAEEEEGGRYGRESVSGLTSYQLVIKLARDLMSNADRPLACTHSIPLQENASVKVGRFFWSWAS